MKKTIMGSILLGLTSLANAAPNIWSNAFAQGFDIYRIEDKQGNSLMITCNQGAGDTIDHSVVFTYKNGKRLQNTDSKYPLSFITNDETTSAPSQTTKWRGGSEQWIDFTSSISTATKIEVFNNNKKVTTFTPSIKNVKNTISALVDCKSMMLRDE